MRRELVVAVVVAALVAGFAIGRTTAKEAPSAEDVVQAQRQAALDELGDAKAPTAFDLGTPLQTLVANIDAALATDTTIDVAKIDGSTVERLEQYNARYERYPFHRFVRDALLDLHAGIDRSDRNRLMRARDVMRGVLGAISLDAQELAEARAAGDDDPRHVPVWANVEGVKTGSSE